MGQANESTVDRNCDWPQLQLARTDDQREELLPCNVAVRQESEKRKALLDRDGARPRGRVPAQIPAVADRTLPLGRGPYSLDQTATDARQRAAQSVINHSPNMWTLIGLGTSVAFVYSVVATVAPQVFPATFVIDGHVAVYFEAAAAIKSLLALRLRGQDLRTH